MILNNLTKIILSLIIFCYTMSSTRAQVLLKCYVKNPISPQISFSYQKNILQPITIDSSKTLSANNIATLSLSKEQPTTITIHYNSQRYEVYCEPNADLSVTFEGETFPLNVQFNGSQLLENNILYKIRSAYFFFNEKWFRTKAYTSSPMAYRKIIQSFWEDKWQLYHNATREDKFYTSEKFRKYLAAEIDYWYALQMLRYESEHQSIFAEETVLLPNAFYDFFNQIIINNEDAFGHRYYTDFIALYADFRLRHPELKQGLVARQTIVAPKNDSVTIYASMDCKEKISYADRKDNLLVLDNLNFYSPVKEKYVAYRLKIRTPENVVGWVIANTVVDKNWHRKINQKQLYINDLEVNSDKEVQTSTPVLETPRLFIDPSDKESYTSLTAAETVTPFGATTNENYGYRDKNQYFTAPFTKIRTSEGNIGWTSVAALKNVTERKRINEWQSQIDTASASDAYHLDYFFHGKTLFYALAKTLVKQIEFNGRASVTRQYDYFMQQCPDLALKQELSIFHRDNDKKYHIDTASLRREEQILDQRVSFFNKTENDFTISLASTDIPTEKMEKFYAQQQKQKIADSLAIVEKRKKTSDFYPTVISYAEKDTAFVAIPLSETKPITFGKTNFSKSTTKLFSNAKNVKKYQLEVNLLPDAVGVLRNKTLFPVQRKHKRFFVSDSIIYNANIVEPTRVVLATPDFQYRTWIEPNQKYKITFKNGRPKINGSADNIANYWIAKEALDKQIEAAFYACDTLSTVKFMAIAKEKSQLKKDFTADFNRKKTLPKRFLNLAMAENTFWYYNLLMDFPKKKKLTSSEKNAYYAFLNNALVQEDKNLQSAEYQRFITQYIDFLYAENNPEKRSKLQLAEAILGGRNLQFWNAKYIATTIQETPLQQDAQILLSKFADENTTPIFNEVIKNIYTEQMLQKEGFDLPSFELRNYQGDIIRKEDVKNRVVLMYFWSSKTPNFKQEMSELYQLELENSEVIFFKINVDKDPILWKNLVKPYRNDPYQCFGTDNNVYTKNLDELIKLDEKKNKIIVDKKGGLSKKLDKTASATDIKTLLQTEINKPDDIENNKSKIDINKERRKRNRSSVWKNEN
jgi:hypothetical protein